MYSSIGIDAVTSRCPSLARISTGKSARQRRRIGCADLDTLR